MADATKGPLIFAAQTFADVAEAADRLGRDHWRELYGEEPYLPDLAAVGALQAEGRFSYFVARTPAGEIVGHVGFFRFYSPVHAADIAMDAFYYVDPAFRALGAAKDLLRFAAVTLRAQGVGTVLVSCFQGSRLGRLIERAGYQRASTMYHFVGA